MSAQPFPNETLESSIREAITSMDAAYNRFSLQQKQEPVVEQLLSSRNKLQALLNELDPVEENVFTEKIEVLTKYHHKPTSDGLKSIFMIERSIFLDGKIETYERLPGRASSYGSIYPIVYMVSKLCQGWTLSPPESLFPYAKTYKVKSSEQEKSDLKTGIEISEDRKTVVIDLDSLYPDLHIHTNGHDIESLANHIVATTVQRYLKLEEERQSNH